jgi:hypothetical protein
MMNGNPSSKTEMVHGDVVTTIMLTAALAVLAPNKLGHPACSLAWWTFHLLKFEHTIWLCLVLASLNVGCFALLVLLAGA